MKQINQAGLNFETKYHGPTNSRGARITATYYKSSGEKVTVSVPYDHGSNSPHLVALQELLDKKLKADYPKYRIELCASTPLLPASYLWQVLRA